MKETHESLNHRQTNHSAYEKRQVKGVRRRLFNGSSLLRSAAEFEQFDAVIGGNEKTPHEGGVCNRVRCSPSSLDGGPARHADEADQRSAEQPDCGWYRNGVYLDR